MYIGEVARRTGLTVKAIRFYEEQKLIAPQRSGRYRLYREQDIELLTLVREATELGATLRQLQGVIQFRDGNVDWTPIRPFLQALRQRLLDQRAQLDARLSRLDHCLEQLTPESSSP